MTTDPTTKLGVDLILTGFLAEGLSADGPVLMGAR